MMEKRALIVDDEPDIRELLDITMKRMGIDTRTAATLLQARELLQHNHFDICLTDMKLPDGNGLNLVNEVKRLYPNLPIAVITAHGSMDTAITALKSGAFDFLTKPVNLRVLRTIVKNAINIQKHDKKTNYKLVGEGVPMQELKKTIEKVSKSQAPVYISGESGTGKERVAQMIHAQGPRAQRPFIPVNCGAIPDDLLESEFFGHRKGSFTGAISDKDGLFKVADGGTLFFDEVAELPQHMQVKLLRSIQEKTIRPIGAQKEISVDIRIVSATNQDLQKLVDAGQFRRDLFYRINVIAIKVPPLRERKEDINLLVDHIVNKISDKESSVCPGLSESAMALLKEYHFPGNIRELENILERAYTMSNGELIDNHDLQLPDQQDSLSPGLNDSNNNLESLLVDIERKQILDALEKTRWNKTAAARLLGISFRALRYRLDKLQLK